MVDAIRLTDALYSWLSVSFSEVGVGLNSPNKRFLSREGNKIMIQLPVQSYILGFERPSGDRWFEVNQYIRDLRGRNVRQVGKSKGLSVVRGDISPIDFFAYLVGLPSVDEQEKNLPQIQEKFDSQMGMRARLMCKKSGLQNKAMFYSPRVVVSKGIEFYGREYEGLGVRAFLMNVPLGENRGLSDRLYGCGAKLLLASLDNSL